MLPKADYKKWRQLYSRGDYAAVTNVIMAMLKDYGEVLFSSLSKDDLMELNRFIGFVFYVFAQEDFVVPENLVVRLMHYNPLLANLIAISDYHTADSVLAVVLKQQDNLVKFLTLYSCYNKKLISIDDVMKINPQLGSIWWMLYPFATAGTLSKEIHNNVTDHLSNTPDNFILPDFRSASVYFNSTYLLEDERKVKEKINQEIQRKSSNFVVKNNPNPNKIAVFTNRWKTTTAVYKTQYDFLKALSQKYHLTLFHATSKNQSIDTSLFKEHYVLDIEKQGWFDCIRNNDFQLAYFPDIGMEEASIILSNIKVAPIMVTNYGHPASTFGSKVDYFLCGQETERHDLIEKNYSEKVILLPGTGAYPIDPSAKYQRQYPELDKDWIRINCCWTKAKINWPMIQNLLEIKNHASRPIKFQFFPAQTTYQNNSRIPFIRQMRELFGDSFVVAGNLDYPDYLKLVETAHFSLDSYPFGGYNTAVDNLYCGCPIITKEGSRFFNRSTAALLRRVGLDDLICTTDREYIDTALDLIYDVDHLNELRNNLTPTGVVKALCVPAEADAFVKAIEHIIANHPLTTNPTII